MKHLALFDINGKIGRGAYETPEFPKASDLIKHMDYLGIDRTLVWHVLARDLAPAPGNQILMDEINTRDEYKNRLIPAQVVTPSNVYEFGGVDKIRDLMRESGSKALRVFPKTSKFFISNLGVLFDAITDLNPVVFWNFRDSNGRTDVMEFRELAERFSHFQFVLTEMFWANFPDALDLMKRFDNVSIDISGLHMWEAIETVVDEFGADRALFGTGGKVHYGASIAALNHADISKEDIELIAHGNLERLLGLTEISQTLAQPLTILDQKPLWRVFRDGGAIGDEEIIDIHAHSTPCPQGWIIRDTEMEDFIPKMIHHMERCGVNHMAIISGMALFGDPVSGNIEGERTLSKYSDYFSGYFVYNPFYVDELVPQLDDAFSRGYFIGFKILPRYWNRPVTDPDYRPLWEFADKHHLPILIHTNNDAGLLSDIAPAYPNAIFIIAHSGGPGREDAVELAKANPNVLLEFCGSFTSPVDWVATIDEVGNDRIAFGSDAGVHNIAWELGRLLSIPVPDDIIKPILAENFKRMIRKEV